MLKQHNKRDDAWTAINGKVYDMTAYIPYHPGGEKELMRVAGRDGTRLFGGNAMCNHRNRLNLHCFSSFDARLGIRRDDA
jgi:cytochrome b involved in lipid metabolism